MASSCRSGKSLDNSETTALYSRVTREESIQKGLSLVNQKRRFEELASNNGWSSTKIYEESTGTSGELPPDQRPALSALLTDAKAGKISRVVVRHLDRLGRGDVLVPVLQILQSTGVEVMTFDGIIEVKSAAGRFMTRVQAAAGAFEIERGGERVREAKRGRAHDGVYIGSAPYGYTSQSRRCRELILNGILSDNARIQAQQEIPVSPGLIIDEAEAKIVELIFDMYVNKRFGSRTIAKELNERGILRRGKPWVSQYVSKLLRDPKLAGFVTYDEDAYEKGLKAKLPIHKQTRYSGKHEAIISEELFLRAGIFLNEGQRQIVSNLKNARIYPLGPVIFDIHGHRMKGNTSDGIFSYYSCILRRRIGPDKEIGGCDFPPINAARTEEVVRDILTKLLSSPEMIMRAWEAAKLKLSTSSPERKQALSELDMEIAGFERERESVFSGLRDVDLDAEQYKIIADRAKELNEKIRKTREQRDEVEQKVVPVQVRRLSQEQVERHLHNLKEKLAKDPARFRDLIVMLKNRHDLRVIALDAYKLRVSLTLKPAAIRGDAGQAARLTADVEPVIDLDRDGETGPRMLTNEEWAARENEKGHFCQCGCGKRINVLPRHRASCTGIPKFIRGSGHWKIDMTDFVEILNKDGYLTIGQLAKELSVCETTLRRYEECGVIKPEYREWGNRYPMRVYRSTDLPIIKEGLINSGFRFKTDEKTMSTQEMAEILGVSASTLRKLERDGAIKSQDRNKAGRRIWQRSEIDNLKKAMKKHIK